MSASVVNPSSWFRSDQVSAVGSHAGDPADVSAHRSKAFQAYQDLAPELNPLYKKYSYFAGIDLRGADPVPSGPAVRAPPAVEGTVVILHDAHGTTVQVPPSLARQGVKVLSLPEIWGAPGSQRTEFLEAGDPIRHKFGALNIALVNHGVDLVTPDDIATPVRVQDISVLSRPHEALSVRRRLRPGRGSKLLYTEEVYSTSSVDHQRLYSSSVDLAPGPGSEVVYMTVHAPDQEAVSFYSRHAVTAADDKIAWIWSGFDGLRTVTRNDSILAAPGGELEDLQTFYGDRRQAYDSAVEVVHRADDTRGQSISRGVYKDESRGMSRGLMRIESNTRKVFSYLSEHAMLLSPKARSDGIPSMEILSAKDVKAAHSHSVAPVDPEKIFYLESRGIAQSDAIRMIAEGFLAHVLDRAPIDGLRGVLTPALSSRWEGRPVLWGAEGALPSLPALSISKWGELGDWRLDTKLRDTAGRA